MPRRILVLEDEPSIAEVYTELLTEEGYEVIVEGGVLPDIQRIAHLDPALIILDHFQAYRSNSAGLQFLRALRRPSVLVAVPVIVCSGASQELLAAQDYLAAQAIQVIAKPFAITALLDAVTRALDPVDHLATAHHASAEQRSTDNAA